MFPTNQVEGSFALHYILQALSQLAVLLRASLIIHHGQR